MSRTLDPADRLPRYVLRPLRVRTAAALPAPNLRRCLALWRTAVRFMAVVLPEVKRESDRWRAAAAEIPSGPLRRTAATALGKRGNIEGAALFAVLAARPHRSAAVRTLVAVQSAYNYLDALCELPSPDPRANARRLHQALLAAVDPHVEHVDYYAHHPHDDDGGYLAALLDVCREGLSGLPSYCAAAPLIRSAACRIVEFQSRNLAQAQGGQRDLESWASQRGRLEPRLSWWESAAGAGSSLPLHALIAMSARPGLGALEAELVDRAYFPVIGALHSLLDSLVDREEDRVLGQQSLVSHYPSTAQMAARLGTLGLEASCACEVLPSAHVHRAILDAMCSYYLSAPQAACEDAHDAKRLLLDALGASLHLAILMFGTRRALARWSGGYT